MIKDDIYNNFLKKKNDIEKLTIVLKETKVTPKKEINDILTNLSTSPLKDSITLYDLLKRPELSIEDLTSFKDLNYSKEVLKEVEINVKYEGYIKKSMEEAKKMLELEDKEIKEDINYQEIPNIASEAKEKLEKIRPITLGQASRISGVNPSDIAIISVYLKKRGI